jgi:zinc protease
MTGVVTRARPMPGSPSPYEFPAFERTILSSGLNLITVHLPGRPLISTTVVFRNGAADEPAEVAGATVLAGRALTEGTERYDAIGLVEAAERLGAELHAEAGWDAMSAELQVPVERLGQGLELLVELVRRPTFPGSEVERLRDQRLADIQQARVDPARRVAEAFSDTVYAPMSPYHRPAGGTADTVIGLDADVARTAYERGVDPASATVIVGGDLSEVDVPALLEPLVADWVASPSARPAEPVVSVEQLPRPRVRVVHRPGSVQSEIRIGHMGLPRKSPDFHAVSVMSMILGGLFNSRLNRKLREEKGYTYGARSVFDFRRGAGPFVVSAPVRTDTTAPAIIDALHEITQMREAPVSEAELRAAKDYLIGVFPFRFQTPGPVIGAIGDLVARDLPDDELARYRPSIEAVSVADVQRVARLHIDPDRLAIVIVGDAEAIGPDLATAGLGDVDVIRDANGAADGRAEGAE